MFFVGLPLLFLTITAWLRGLAHLAFYGAWQSTHLWLWPAGVEIPTTELGRAVYLVVALVGVVDASLWAPVLFVAVCAVGLAMNKRLDREDAERWRREE